MTVMKGNEVIIMTNPTTNNIYTPITSIAPLYPTRPHNFDKTKTLVIAIDPSTTSTGYAVYDGGVDAIISTATITQPHDLPISTRYDRMRAGVWERMREDIHKADEAGKKIIWVVESYPGTLGYVDRTNSAWYIQQLSDTILTLARLQDDYVIPTHTWSWRHLHGLPTSCDATTPDMLIGVPEVADEEDHHMAYLSIAHKRGHDLLKALSVAKLEHLQQLNPDRYLGVTDDSDDVAEAVLMALAVADGNNYNMTSNAYRHLDIFGIVQTETVRSWTITALGDIVMVDQYHVANGWPIDQTKLNQIINDADGLSMFALSAHQAEGQKYGTTIWTQPLPKEPNDKDDDKQDNNDGGDV